MENVGLIWSLNSNYFIIIQWLIDWLIDWLTDWLVFNGTSKQKGAANCGRGKSAQAAKEGQQDTVHTTLCYTITM
jgi:hypothetical protein